MAVSAGNAEMLRGANAELHMSPDGLALVPTGPYKHMATEVAEYEEVASVEADPRGRRLQVIFAGERATWTIEGGARPEVLWAKDTVDRAVARARARQRDIFKKRASLEELEQAIRDLAEGAEPQSAILAELILMQAILHRATDVHLQPAGEDVKVRYRVDGHLLVVGSMPQGIGERVVARLKVIAGMKSYAQKMAQSGRTYLHVDDRTVDMRLTALPTIHGEKLTARLFDPATALLELEALGFEAEALAGYRQIVGEPRGCVIMTGPAGAGKTTTMYASLAELRETDGGRSICTVEEPVELDLAGVDQTEVNRDVGMDFAACLRTVLRQDPQIIMVGEIRDYETAEIAMQAALTGHLIFTTVHAPSAAGVFARLMDLGLEPYVIASGVSAIVAQRLVRKVCAACAETYQPTPEELAAAGLTQADTVGWECKRAVGCDECEGTGYHGRTGIFELLPVTAALRAAIMERRPVPEVERLAATEGIGSLWEAGLAKVAAGVTTLDELRSVLGRREG